MIYKHHKCGSYNIHTVKTNKFKTMQIEIVFRNNIDEKTLGTRSLLFDMLVENSNRYKTRREISLREEELYSTFISTYSSKLGNVVYSSIIVNCLDPKYLNDSLEDIIKFPFELIFEPNVIDEEFDKETLNFIKERTITEIESIKEEPRSLAIQNALKEMDSNSISSKLVQGTKEEIESITPSSLYETYKYVLKHDYVDIYVLGNFNEDEVINLINKYAKFNTIKTHPLELFISNNIRKKEILKTENSSYKESNIVFLLNTLDLTEYERKYVMPVFNQILGGGSLETKLSKNLRSKKSLCYSIGSLYQKYDNLLLIRTGVEKSNVDKSISEIKKTIKEMNNITDDEMRRAISSILASINMGLDSPGRLIDNYMFNTIGELDLIEERLKIYKKVSKEDVLKLNKKIKLNTIYVLEGE